MDGHDTPLVAIITRTKNRPLLLHRTCMSILHQTYKNYISIIVNDGGDEDNLQKLIEEIWKDRPQTFPRIVNINSGGFMEEATNAGISEALRCSANIISILDDDDTWSPEFLRIMVQELINNKKYCQGIVCRSNIIYEKIDGNTILTLKMEPANLSMPRVGILPISYLANVDNNFGVNQFIYWRSALSSLSRYNEKLTVYGDWEFNLRFISEMDILVIPNFLAFYHKRLEGNSLNITTQSLQISLCKNMIINKHLRDRTIFAPFFQGGQVE